MGRNRKWQGKELINFCGNASRYRSEDDYIVGYPGEREHSAPPGFCPLGQSISWGHLFPGGGNKSRLSEGQIPAGSKPGISW